jgi:hypothetical protein
MSVDTEARDAVAVLEQRLQHVRIPVVDDLIRRGHRRRVIRRGVAVVACAAVVVGAVVLTASDPERVRVTAPADGASEETPTGSVGTRFVPPTVVRGATAIVPMTLPDGSRYEMLTPTSTGIAQMGFVAQAAVEWPLSPDPLRCCSRVVSIEYTTIAREYGDASPIATFRGVDGKPVPYYRVQQRRGYENSPTSVHYLVFQFGPWMVEVPDHDMGDFEDQMTEAALEQWSRSLDGFVDGDGYLVLTPRPPLTVAHLVSVAFGGRTPGSDWLEITGNVCGDEPGAATPVYFDVAEAEAAATWCDAGTALRIRVEGSAAFVDATAAGFSIRTTS